jgi:ABC-type lipopolysaccharide export system ATPase subunit
MPGKAALDAARNAWRQSQARIAQLQAQIKAGQASAGGATYALDQRRVVAGTSGPVQDILFRPGEFVGAGTPIVSILPPGQVFARFFVPEPQLARVKIGGRVAITCDGCRPMEGTITFIAAQAEYTPPWCSAWDHARSWCEGGGAQPGRVALAPRPADRGAAIVTTHHAIDVRGLTKRFGDKLAVDGVDIAVPSGEVWGFRGPNGSGKTTVIRMLCGLLRADAGEGTCLGLDFRREAEAIKRQVGYMTQKFSFWEDLSIRENLEFVARMYGMDRPRARVDDALERLGLTARSAQLAGHLSGGWKQRMALAACMLHEPRLLLLDEPTAASTPRHGAISGTRSRAVRKRPHRAGLHPLHG